MNRFAVFCGTIMMFAVGCLDDEVTLREALDGGSESTLLTATGDLPASLHHRCEAYWWSGGDTLQAPTLRERCVAELEVEGRRLRPALYEFGHGFLPPEAFSALHADRTTSTVLLSDDSHRWSAYLIHGDAWTWQTTYTTTGGPPDLRDPAAPNDPAPQHRPF